MLYIVPTPIGNLEDITLRAIRNLKETDIIACEDTRKSMILLNHYEIKKPLISFHSHSGVTKVDKIIKELESGKDISLISDAGTPGISDPGYVLVKEAIKNNIEVCALPGPSACLTALSASGLPSNHFLYLGFMPIKKGRQTLFKRLQDKKETVVIYESVHRIKKTIKEIGEYMGDVQIVVGRELTKKFEEYIRGNSSEILEYMENNPGKIKGEFVIIF